MSADAPETRELSPRELQTIVEARDKAFVLYEGVRVRYRSCGIALAETFNLPTRPYQSLRSGGVTREGSCGSIKAGELILGEYFGDLDPTAPVTEVLGRAIRWYQAQVPLRIQRGQSPDYICKNLTAPLGDFAGDARKSHCTNLTAIVAELTAEALLRFKPDLGLVITVIPDL